MARRPLENVDLGDVHMEGDTLRLVEAFAALARIIGPLPRSERGEVLRGALKVFCGGRDATPPARGGITAFLVEDTSPTALFVASFAQLMERQLERHREEKGNREGYTSELARAGTYTADQAQSIERMRGEDLAVPLDIAVCEYVEDRFRNGNPAVIRALRGALTKAQLHRFVAGLLHVDGCSACGEDHRDVDYQADDQGVGDFDCPKTRKKVRFAPEVSRG